MLNTRAFLCSYEALGASKDALVPPPSNHSRLCHKLEQVLVALVHLLERLFGALDVTPVESKRATG